MDHSVLQAYFGNPANGSLLSKYTWGAENRLIAYEPLVPQSGSKRVEFGYDYMSRRTEKRVYTHNGSAWATTPSEHKRFVWNGWLMLLEIDETAGTPPTIAVRRKQAWGLDLAGQHGGGNSLESAGGIGGLLSIYDTVGTGSTGDDRSFALLYDANGNVGQLLELTAGTNYGAVAAAYEYDAYGNRINTPASGEYEQPWRFSTKQFDGETGLNYYGYRYYAGRMGRWINRDPIGESGGPNLTMALANSAPLLVDPRGLCTWLATVTAKSYIGPLGGPPNWGIRPEWCLGGLWPGFIPFLCATDLAFSEDPEELVGSFRLMSNLGAQFECCDGRLTNAKIRLTYDVGFEGPLKGLGYLVVNGVSTTTGTSFIDDILRRGPVRCLNLSWTVYGRPNPGVDLGFLIAGLPRTEDQSWWIWHQVDASLCCDGSEGTVSAQLSGSVFPSHRLWINGRLTQELLQGSITDLLSGDPLNPWRVRGRRTIR
ncbi:MAG: RHS repeat-associated core domain-containing protein [Phycisphaerae bacterium]